ncbi:hypothetical protein FGO68_gene15848 [Halteria grandinella]|uniref:Serine hydrolase domain-containing protein n=1 Tax=Halteria grandinella TaxID=5974 RepID=A0A8J8SUV3_HALGN|nr:hypothetical protein FGO68_gene15848 [Halteria grandinella]
MAYFPLWIWLSTILTDKYILPKIMTEIKQKVLCFHGFGTNSNILSYQLRQFKKEFTSLEFITMNGSIPVDRNVILSQYIRQQWMRMQ